MTFNPTPAGVITKEQTLLSIRRLPVDGGANIVKGNICEAATDLGGIQGSVLVSPTTQTVNTDHFVALANADNTSGSDGAISVPLAVRGHFVTVVADGIINPGDYTKCSSNTAGQAMRFVPGTDNNNLRIGIYWGKEGGTITKSSTTPYLESFTDNADFVPVPCADQDIIEMEIL